MIPNAVLQEVNRLLDEFRATDDESRKSEIHEKAKGLLVANADIDDPNDLVTAVEMMAKFLEAEV